MKTRILHTKIWSDSWFRRLDTTEKVFFLYLISNELVNIIHLYELPISVATMQTNIPVEDLERIREKFQADNKLDFYGDYVLINNAYKYQYYKGIKNNRLKLRLVFEMSDDTIKHYSKTIIDLLREIEDETLRFSVSDLDFINLYKRLSDRMSYLGLCEYTYQDTPIPILRINQNTEIINNKSEYRNQNTEKKVELDPAEVEKNMEKLRALFKMKGISNEHN